MTTSSAETLSMTVAETARAAPRPVPTYPSQDRPIAIPKDDSWDRGSAH
jgi:hypothetical protein